MSIHPSESVEPATPVQVTPSSDPLLIWLGLIKPRLDTALANVDQAYRDAKLAATAVDTTNRRAADERRKADPLGASEAAIFDNASDALHRTHLRAMDSYGALAGAMASSIRDALSMQAMEIEEVIAG